MIFEITFEADVMTPTRTYTAEVKFDNKVSYDNFIAELKKLLATAKIKFSTHSHCGHIERPGEYESKQYLCMFFVDAEHEIVKKHMEYVAGIKDLKLSSTNSITTEETKQIYYQ